jgi:hypothetical protein
METRHVSAVYCTLLASLTEDGFFYEYLPRDVMLVGAARHKPFYLGPDRNTFCAAARLPRLECQKPLYDPSSSSSLQSLMASKLVSRESEVECLAGPRLFCDRLRFFFILAGGLTNCCFTCRVRTTYHSMPNKTRLPTENRSGAWGPTNVPQATPHAHSAADTMNQRK